MGWDEGMGWGVLVVFCIRVLEGEMCGVVEYGVLEYGEDGVG